MNLLCRVFFFFFPGEINSSILLNSSTNINIIRANGPFSRIALDPQPSCISAIVTPSNSAAQDQRQPTDPSEMKRAVYAKQKVDKGEVRLERDIHAAVSCC